MENDTPQASDQVLFVDDEENILKALRRLFMDKGYEIFAATSGREALDILKINPDIGVIVSDQRMPRMTGVDFFEQSRKITPNAIRILLTGYADINAAVDAINRGGAYKYLTKPWRDEDVVQAVAEALQRYGLIKENKRLNALVKKQNEELKNWNSELEIIVQKQTMELQREYDKIKTLHERQRGNFKKTIIAFSGLLELRDKGMRSHSGNVAEIAAKVARALEMGPEEIETIVAASLLHDIGKIGIPDFMLRMDPDNMDGAALEEYRKHPIRGQAAIDTIVDLRKIGVVIRHHHERYDGRGFPDKLKGKDIPLAARIIAIADYVDKTVRRFEGDSGVALTLRKVADESGKRFDPKLPYYFEVPVRDIYRKLLDKTDYIELQLHPRELKGGMVLGRDVSSGTGLLLLSKGTRLNKANIEVLRRYYELDPSKAAISVWSKRG